MNIAHLKHPLGILQIAEEEGFIVSIKSVDKIAKEDNDTKTLKLCLKELKLYFDKKLKHFTTPIKIIDKTDFQNLVYNELLKIEYGTVKSYKDIANNIGHSRAYRAVGGANNKNPIPIIVPCHRVIGSSGKLTGYNMGIELKEFLLKIEGIKTNTTQ